MFTSCVDANPNIEVDNHINISIDGDNVDGIQGEWKITSIEKKEDGKEIIIIRIENLIYNNEKTTYTFICYGIFTLIKDIFGFDYGLILAFVIFFNNLWKHRKELCYDFGE